MKRFWDDCHRLGPKYLYCTLYMYNLGVTMHIAGCSLQYIRIKSFPCQFSFISIALPRRIHLAKQFDFCSAKSLTLLWLSFKYYSTPLLIHLISSIDSIVSSFPLCLITASSPIISSHGKAPREEKGPSCAWIGQWREEEGGRRLFFACKYAWHTWTKAYESSGAEVQGA
jgi:hypothetical protein